jgi:hypothetical protein
MSLQRTVLHVKKQRTLRTHPQFRKAEVLRRTQVHWHCAWMHTCVCVCKSRDQYTSICEPNVHPPPNSGGTPPQKNTRTHARTCLQVGDVKEPQAGLGSVHRVVLGVAPFGVVGGGGEVEAAVVVVVVVDDDDDDDDDDGCGVLEWVWGLEELW